MDQAQWMNEAFALAEEAAAAGEIPIGAVVADRSGRIIGRGRNRREEGYPLAHAEMLAIAEAAQAVGDWRLEGTTMAVTLEPCAMFAGALVNALVERLIFGAYDPKGGAVEHGPRLFDQPTTHHRPEIYGGIEERRASELLRSFFRTRREE